LYQPSKQEMKKAPVKKAKKAKKAKKRR
jgi:hypothetical protein